MKRSMSSVLILIFTFMVFSVAGNFAQEKIVKAEKAMTASKNTLQKKVATEFKNHCAVSGCHKGQFPKKKLNLEPDKFYDAIVEVPSLQVDSLKLVDTQSPEKSYLLMKIRGEKGIVEARMPIDAPPLKTEEIEVIEKWIVSLKVSETMEKKTVPPSEMGKKNFRQSEETEKVSQFTKPAFWGTQLINLPTSQMIGKNNLLFRVSHRFIRKIDSGYDTYYGLNGPAFILVGFGYGILDNLGVTIGHSNFNHEWELGANWLALQRGQITLLPVSVAIHASGSLITSPEPCQTVWRSENFKFNVQVSLEHQISDAIALMLVPSFSTNTDYNDPLSQNTFALGTGGRFMFLENITIVGEWLPILSGFKNKHNYWGLGLEYKVGGHVFHVFITNSYGLTSDQYITGGELNLKDNDYRFGFNIYRTFWF